MDTSVPPWAGPQQPGASPVRLLPIPAGATSAQQLQQLQYLAPPQQMDANQKEPNTISSIASGSALEATQLTSAVPAIGSIPWAALPGPAVGGPSWDADSVSLGRKVMQDFLRTSRAYDIVPESNKVVVFDTAVPIRLAFYALVEHDTACAPLWDGERCSFAGLLTTSDIVDIMRVFYTPGSGAPASAALSELTIAAWRQFAGSVEGLRQGLSSPDFQRASEAFAGEQRDQAARQAASAAGQQQQDDAMGSGQSSSAFTTAAALRRAHKVHSRLISIDPEDDLLAVCAKLRKHRIHHMPVLDTEQAAVICILSHRHLLQHVVSRFNDSRRLFDVPLYALGVGSFDDVVVVPTSASVISVLNVLAERRISAVPVVNDSGQVVDVYSRDDVTFLAHDPSLMVLDAPVGEVRRAQVAMMGPSTPLVTCDRMDSLHRALELFGATAGRCERLVCVDEHRRCTGVVSLSDIFAFFASKSPPLRHPHVLQGAGQGEGEGFSNEGLGLALDAGGSTPIATARPGMGRSAELSSAPQAMAASSSAMEM